MVAEHDDLLEASASEIQTGLLARLRASDHFRVLLRLVEGDNGELRSPTATGSWLSRLAGSARPLGWTFAKTHSGARTWVISPPSPQGEPAAERVSKVSEVSEMDNLDTLDILLQASSPAVDGDIDQDEVERLAELAREMHNEGKELSLIHI